MLVAVHILGPRGDRVEETLERDVFLRVGFGLEVGARGAFDPDEVRSGLDVRDVLFGQRHLSVPSLFQALATATT